MQNFDLISHIQLYNSSPQTKSFCVLHLTPNSLLQNCVCTFSTVLP